MPITQFAEYVADQIASPSDSLRAKWLDQVRTVYEADHALEMMKPGSGDTVRDTSLYALNPLEAWVNLTAFYVVGLQDSRHPNALPAVMMKESGRNVENDYQLAFQRLRLHNVYREWVAQSVLYGGAFLAMRKDLRDWFMLASVAPDSIFVVYDPMRNWDIKDAYAVSWLDAEAAGEHGISTTGTHQYPLLYIEHWDRKKKEAWYSQNLGANPRKLGVTPNPYSPYVPVLFLPRFRMNNFWGSSLVTELKDAVVMINADMGTASSAAVTSSTPTGIAVDVSSPENSSTIALKTGAVTLLKSDNIMGGGRPIVQFYTGQSNSVQSTSEFITKMIQFMRETSFLPPEAWGSPGSSQRSSLAAEMYMVPTVNMVHRYRAAIVTELEKLLRMIYKMAQIGLPQFKGLELPDPDSLLVQFDFPSFIPRDEKGLHAILDSHVANKVLSPQTAVSIGYPHLDPEEETERIVKFSQQVSGGNGGRVHGNQDAKRETAQLSQEQAK